MMNEIKLSKMEKGHTTDNWLEYDFYCYSISFDSFNKREWIIAHNYHIFIMNKPHADQIFIMK